MIKSKFGPITNPKTGMSKDIVINALSKESLVHAPVVLRNVDRADLVREPLDRRRKEI